MDADFRAYLKAAHGEEPPARKCEPRWTETESLARRLIGSSQAEAALKAIEQESPAVRRRWDLLLLTGLLHVGLGERGPAIETLEIVGDKLLAAGDREGVEALLPRFLDPEPVGAAVRFLHFLARRTGDDMERIPMLREALAIRPLSPEIHAELAQALERTGDASGARDHRLRAAELFLEAGRPDVVGEDLLRAVEEDLAHQPARVAQLLLHHAALAPWEEAEPLIELALPELEPRVAGHIRWTHVAPAASHAPASEASRSLFARFLRLVVAREPDPDSIVAGSGIRNAALSIEQVGRRLAKILTLPPGARVQHTAWGLGRVTANDGESVTLAFPGKEDHRMTLAMASRALDRLPAEGVRVLAVEQPERLRAWIAEGDPESVLAALRDLGGTGSAAQIRQRLEPHLTGVEWGPWWKEVRERLKQDPRVDGREAYRQVYRLVLEGEALEEQDVPLPEFRARQGASGLNLLKQFLREHPDLEERVRESVAPIVAAWAKDSKLDPGQRAQALAYVAGWKAAPEAVIRGVLMELIGLGLSPDDVTVAQAQEQLLDLAEGAVGEPEFLWRAIESRLPRLRERGRARLRALVGPEGFARAVEQRITRPAGATGVAARLVVHYAERPDDPGAPPPAALLLAAVRLLERERELESRHAESLTALLTDDGALARLFRPRLLDAESREVLERTVLHWQGSERRLDPILDFLKRVGEEAIAHAHETRRSERASSLVEGRTLDDIETQHTVMTRVTYRKLEEEARRIGLELKTSVPAAIEKARALGDLRENAEYEAAKQRQANAAARLQSLLVLLARTRLLESIEVDASKVGVGTEVELAPLEGEGRIRYWILGEGDNQLGPGIISYRAPIARPLLGKPVGAEVTIPTGDGERTYRITAIEKRLPADA